jgi:hypothetical protein
MMRVLTIILLGLIYSCANGLAAIALPPLPEVTKQGDALIAGAGSIVERDGIKVLHLRGTPLEMGIQQGLLLGKEAEALRPYVDPSMQNHTGMDALAWKFRDFYMRTKLTPTFIRNIPLRYLEEMQGFVYGVSQGRDTDITPVLVGNVFQELALLMCTSVAAWGPASVDGHLYHARNLDNSLPLQMTKSALVMVVEPDGRIPYIMLTVMPLLFMACITPKLAGYDSVI